MLFNSKVRKYMGGNGQMPTVVIETDSEDVITNSNKDKIQLRSAKFGRMSGSGVQLLIGEDSLVQSQY